MHFSGDGSDTDISYYAIPVWNEVVVYHYYIFDVRDANGKIVSGGGNLFEPCRTKITYKYCGMSLVVDKAYEQIAYDSNNNLIAQKTDNATLFFYYDTYNRLVETIV